MQAHSRLYTKIIIAGAIMILIASCTAREKTTDLTCKATCKQCGDVTLECSGKGNIEHTEVTGGG